MDFVADELFNGRRIRALTVVDNAEIFDKVVRWTPVAFEISFSVTRSPRGKLPSRDSIR